MHSSEEHTRLYGFDPEQGSPSFEDWRQRVHPEDLARVSSLFERASLTRSDVDVHFRVVLPDGKTRYVQAVGHAVVEPSGGQGEFVGILMDVTERRRADEERERLRQVQADLAHMARVTTIGELTASLTHEIKQPISAAGTDAGACLRWLARDVPDVAEARAAALGMVEAVSRAGDIINSISMLFKKGALQRARVDVNALIREMVVLVRSEANRHAIVIGTQLDPGVPKVMADRVQLQQVFMNLMLNGIDAMREGGVVRELTIKSAADIDRFLISVSDTGVGLPVGEGDQIFKAFFTTKSHGTGMGLPISRSIIESHGGRLWATANTPRPARSLSSACPSQTRDDRKYL